jgi:hypothetical protein
VLEVAFSPDPITVDVRAVQASQVAKNETTITLLHDAMLFGDDLVQELNRVVRVTTEAVNGAELNRLLPLGGRKDQLRHPNDAMLARPRVWGQEG